MTPVTRATGVRYGAPELQAAYQRCCLSAFGIAVSCHLLVLVWYSPGEAGVRIIPDPAPHRPDGPVSYALPPLPWGNPVLPNVRTLPPTTGWDRPIPIPVNMEGRPDKAGIESSDNELFNESALEAAGRFVLTPGAMTSGPVAVWVSLPFTFRLEEGAR